MPYPATRISSGSPGDTLQNDSTNNAQSFGDAIKYRDGDPSNDSSGNRAKQILITVEGNAIRFTFGSTPTQDGGTALGHVLSSGESLLLTSWVEIKEFQYISKINGSHSTLQITPSY